MIEFLNPLYAKTDNEILQEVGKMLKNRRLLLNVTQQEFADTVGISKDQLSKIERTGKTSLATFVAIARKLNLLQEFINVLELPELSPIQKFEIENKIQKFKTKRIRVRK